LGLGLYGYAPKTETGLQLKPVLSLKTIISSVKNIKAGQFVGYNATYQAKHDMKIATIPVGYFEGIDRRLSSVGYVRVVNSDCPIIGRVSMNITTIDVNVVPDLKPNESVEVISSNPNDKNSAANIAKLAGTIIYEILVHLPPHLRRTII